MRVEGASKGASRLSNPAGVGRLVGGHFWGIRLQFGGGHQDDWDLGASSLRGTETMFTHQRWGLVLI